MMGAAHAYCFPRAPQCSCSALPHFFASPCTAFRRSAAGRPMGTRQGRGVTLYRHVAMYTHLNSFVAWSGKTSQPSVSNVSCGSSASERHTARRMLPRFQSRDPSTSCTALRRGAPRTAEQSTSAASIADMSHPPSNELSPRSPTTSTSVRRLGHLRPRPYRPRGLCAAPTTNRAQARPGTEGRCFAVRHTLCMHMYQAAIPIWRASLRHVSSSTPSSQAARDGSLHGSC